jgi:hypothetical protein
LNFPISDNCPYANASAYYFDPLYIGIRLFLKTLGVLDENAPYYPGIPELLSSIESEAASLERRKNLLMPKRASSNTGISPHIRRVLRPRNYRENIQK